MRRSEALRRSPENLLELPAEMRVGREVQLRRGCFTGVTLGDELLS